MRPYPPYLYAISQNTSPMTPFVRTWAACMAAHTWWAHAARLRYYTWFASSDILLARKPWRGLGSRGHPAFGLVPIPRLTVRQFNWMGYIMVALLATLAAIADESHDSTFVACVAFIAFIAYFVYFGQLFAESSGGLHASLMMPAVLWYATFDAPRCAAWTQWHLLSLYWGAGLCKLAGSVYTQTWWANGTTFHSCIITALCSRPARTPWVRRVQRWFVVSPRACTVASWLGLLFECVAPMLVVFYNTHEMRALFAMSAMGFHAGVYALMGIDFMSGWGPALVAFFCASSSSSSSASGVGVAVGAMAAAAYLVAQCVAAVTLNEATGGTGPMPLSCMPMFALPTDIFGRSNMVNWFVMMDGSMRVPGHHGVLEWSGPPFDSHWLPHGDLARMPFRVLMFGNTRCAPSEYMRRLVRDDARGRDELMYANFPTSAKLVAACRAFNVLLLPASNNASTSTQLRSEASHLVLHHLDAIAAEFNKQWTWQPPTDKTE
jgi:hypothetical protein